MAEQRKTGSEQEQKARDLKTYYVATEGLDVHYGPISGDDVQNRVRGVISFTRGMFQTADPDQQDFLDKYPGCVSEETWRVNHIPLKELDEQRKRENERLQNENNRLLAKVRELEGAKK